METYYFVGMRTEDSKIEPVGDWHGEDNHPDPLFTTEKEAKEYRDHMQEIYYNEKYYCLKAVIMEEEHKMETQEGNLEEQMEHQIKDSAVFMQRMGVYGTVEEAEEDIRASWERINEEQE